MADKSGEKPLRSMTKAELIELIEDAAANIEDINTAKAQIGELVGTAESTVEKINEWLGKAKSSVDGISAEAEKADTQQTRIAEYYAELFGGDDDDDESATKELIDEFVAEFGSIKEKIEEAMRQIYGDAENDEGEGKGHVGYVNKMQETVEHYTEQYKSLLTEVNALIAHATTVKLSKNFLEKAAEFKNERMKWEKIMKRFFYWSLVLVGGGLALWYFLGSTPTWEASLLQMLRLSPLAGIFTWALVFMGNRRAECRKLEESYAHKAVLAQSFMGYKEAIAELSEQDAELLGKLMENLLNAIDKNASDFLSVKGEKHPVHESLSNARLRKAPKFEPPTSDP